MGQILTTEVSAHYASCISLHELLSEEWKIEPPIYVRPHWQSPSVSNERKRTCHFVLWRDNHINLVSIPEGPQVQQFLVEAELAVDCL